MDSESTGTLTSVLAILGVILSSIAIGWNIFRDLSDRGKLRVEAMIGRFPGQENRLLFITLTNIGRKPILVTKMYAKHKSFKEGFTLFVPLQLPKMLSPAEYLQEFQADISTISEDLIGIWAEDSMGKEWGISRKNRTKLLKDKQKIELENTSTKETAR